MSKEQIGKRIRELREIQDETRESFAEKVGISSKFLYEIETGKKGFSADILCNISKVLSVSCEYIMLGEEGVYPDSEKIICFLETLRPSQRSQIRVILQKLSDLCDTD